MLKATPKAGFTVTKSGIVEIFSITPLARCTGAAQAHILETCDLGSILGPPAVQSLGFSISPSKPEHLQTFTVSRAKTWEFGSTIAVFCLGQF